MNTQTIDYQTPAGSTDSCNEPVESEAAKNALQNTTKRNKRKATRPKAPTPASALFSQVESAKIQADHPSATSTEVFQLLGAKWKTADANTKAQWVAEYVALSDAKQAGEARSGTTENIKPRKRKAATRSKAPTPASALFSQVESAKIQADHPSATSTEVFQLLGAKWKTADANTKAQWVAEYVALSDAKHADGPAVSLATRRRTAKPVTPPKRRDAKEPKRACTPFILFSQVERASVKAEHPTATPAEICKRLGEKWHAAEADTKAKFAALYATNKAHADQMRRAYACTKL
jgi:high mobility group protein B1